MLGLIGVLFFEVKNIREKVKILDVFVSQHDNLLGVPIVYKKTEVGGFFSILFVLSAGIIIISSILSFEIDNISEVKTLVPLISLDDSFSVDFLQISFVYFIYGGICELNNACSSLIFINDSGLSYSKKSMNCN